MKFLYSNDLIIACSTCTQAHAALAVIRISGFNDLAVFKGLFRFSGPIEPRRVYYTQLIHQNEVIDDICLTFFKAPHSFNGENILELSVHGNTLNVERILNLFIEQGCRLASPGEFTYRALKNKKLSLSQVEGLDLFLNANSGFALDQGLSLLSGQLHQIYDELYDLFLKHKSALELSIDFIDDVGEETAHSYLHSSLQDFKKKFEQLHRRVLPLDINLIQPEIVIAGLPNSGKSSLFNLLLRDDRAIVSSQAGTTRDFLSEIVVISGVKYKIFDTAGIRSSEDFIEAEGIKRSRAKMANSFFKILLINPFEMDPEFNSFAHQSFDAVYFTHSDLDGFNEARSKVLNQYPFLGPMGAFDLNNFTANNENDLFAIINKKYLNLTKDKPILLDRHKTLINQVHLQLEGYVNLISYETDVAVISHELNTLASCLTELLGIVSPDQVLHSLLYKTCIVK